jgi:signal transduction histidine kinase
MYRIVAQSEAIHKEQVFSQLNYDAQLLTRQLDQNLNTLLSDINLLSLPDEKSRQLNDDVQKLLERRREIFHLNYFSADGILIYSSTKATLEWHSNLLNAPWYRALIREWNITVTDIHKSPLSPFPDVIALAVPVSGDKQIVGFWLLYLDILKVGHLFPGINNPASGKLTIWFDGNGEIFSLNPFQTEINSTFIKSNGWWYRINEMSAEDETVVEAILTTHDALDNYLYGTNHSSFKNIQVLVIQDQQTALAPFYDFKTSIIILGVLLQFIIMVVTAVILWNWLKQKTLLTELINVNNLLEVKSDALSETNKKSEMLVSELAEQKNQLLETKNSLDRFQKYLNFLTVPVIALDDNMACEFVNRSSEIEFGYSFEKVEKKPLGRFLQFENEMDLTQLLELAKKSLQRQESKVSIRLKNTFRYFMVSCDYLILSDWQGYIITFTDLTELLNLQKNIENQNLYLENSNKLAELFLQPQTEKAILNKVLGVIQEFTRCKAIYYYSVEDGHLLLKESASTKPPDSMQSLSAQSITGSTLLSGKPVIIRDKTDMPSNAKAVEQKWDFTSAVFQPVIIDSNSVGVVIVIDPKEEITADYDNTLLKLLTHFKIGVSALISKQDLEKANTELQKSSELRAQLLRSITHGLSTPLSTVKGYIKLILLKFSTFISEQPEAFNYLKKLEAAGEDMDEKIKMYLDIARMNRNDLKLEFSKASVAELVEPVFDALNKEAQTKNIKINVTGQDEFNKNITIDLRRYIFALKIILINALKYAPENDNVKLNINEINNHISISFEDHGKQISKENIPLIGKEFLSADLMKDRLHYGDSLPIALAVEIIRLGNGKMIVNSIKDKTLHTIELPLNTNDV